MKIDQPSHVSGEMAGPVDYSLMTILPKATQPDEQQVEQGAEHPRIISLRSKHAALEKEINELYKCPAPDQCKLTELKREKLRLKEEIERLRIELN